MDNSKIKTAGLIEKERLLNNKIEALNDELRGVENELFYRKNPECRD